MNNKNIIAVGLVVLFVIGGSIGGYFIYQGRGRTGSQENIANQPQSSSSAPTSPSKQPKIDTADWETYTNEEYGFEIRYPGNWTFEEKLPQPQNFGVETEFRDSEGNYMLSISSPIPEVGFIGFKIVEQRKIPVEGSTKSLEKITYYFPEDGSYLIHIWWDKDNWKKSGEISFGYKGKSDPNLNILDQILSTFRLIDKNETADWKTYTNQEYGFEVKYPQDWDIREDIDTTGESFFGGKWKVSFGERGEVTSGEGEKIPIEKIGFSVKFYDSTSELWENEKNLSLEDWIFKTYPLPREGEIRKTITFGANNYSGILLKTYKALGVIKLITTIYAEKNGSIFELKGEVPTIVTAELSTQYDYDKVFNQMLSTFKFLE